ncbi:MerR family transcriptional regulator [Mycobacterium avium]|uniref:MerR family transcriptional regulator n=1 Tax=Mycobacterium avium TaxID=1764 RepID=UPI000B4B4158|nr:helix-turn-helix domain-containing protein [Mycobacterium avium]QBC87350.1 MerR family DNA-binding transcriptional regulator [Mycobacterium avium subsp. hominissuis]
MQGKHPASSDELISPGEAAALLGVHVDTVKRWERDGRISSLRTPLNHRRYRRGDVEKLLTEAAS